MCRLIVVTKSAIPLNKRLVLFDRAMLLGAAEGNHDGWGVAMNHFLVKDGVSFIRNDSQWISAIRKNGDGLLMGHVRAASKGTRINDETAQPFKFRHFIGMHNGTIHHSWKNSSVDVASPGSDTYRVFHRLDGLLDQNNGNITTSVIEEWLSLYADASSFAFVLKQDRRLFILRNSKRMLYYSNVADGAIVHTSPNALVKLSQWSHYAFGFSFGEIYDIAPHTLWELDENGMWIGHPLNIVLHPYRRTQQLSKSVSSRRVNNV